jgi:DnaJ-class molecular chaperone
MSDELSVPMPFRDRFRRERRRRQAQVRAWWDRVRHRLCPDCHGDGVQVHPLDAPVRARIKGSAWMIYPHRVRVRECPTCDGTGRVRRWRGRRADA